MFAYRISLALAVVACVLGCGRGAPENPTLSFIAVGQGDCALIESGKWDVLIDAAPANEYGDAGERIVLPELRSREVRALDLVFITHPDADHVGGLQAIARRHKIGAVVVNSKFADRREITEVTERYGIKVITVEKSMVFDLDSTMIRVYAPEAFDSDIDGSLLIRLEVDGTSALFTGDAGFEVEERAMMSGIDWDVDLLVAGHHGSKNSTSTAWLKATSPDIAVASAGRNNIYGHPHPDVEERLAEYGAELLRTDELGTIRFEVVNGAFRQIRN